MNDSTRARVAAVVAASSKGQNISSVHDYSGSGYVNTSVSINNGQISGYDYSTSMDFPEFSRHSIMSKLNCRVVNIK